MLLITTTLINRLRLLPVGLSVRLWVRGSDTETVRFTPEKHQNVPRLSSIAPLLKVERSKL